MHTNGGPHVKRLAVVYHSIQGNTEEFARHVLEGAQRISSVDTSLLRAVDLTSSPERLAAYDGIIWGSPTYFGGVSGPFKSFMDASGYLWRKQGLRGKLASGFTVSSLPSGDKLTALLSMFVFSMQHGMIWVGNPGIPEDQEGVPHEEAANRLGSWAGAMGQASHMGPTGAFVPGDLKTARVFGENFARTLVCYRCNEQRAAVPALS